MSFLHFLYFLKTKRSSLILAGLFVSALSFFSLTLTEERFKTTTDFMVVQTGNVNQDFYTLFKTAEYLSKALTEGIKSESFITALIETGKINSEFLPFEKGERLAKWREIVSIEKDVELGVLRVSLKSENEKTAKRVMDGVGEVLIQKNMLFRGGEEKSVDVRVLSGPITKRNPSPRDIVIVLTSGFLAGVGLILLFLTFRMGELPLARPKLSIPKDMNLLSHVKN